MRFSFRFVILRPKNLLERQTTIQLYNEINQTSLSFASHHGSLCR